MKKQRILITGGAGFIGSHLAKSFNNNELIIVDNLSSGDSNLIRDFKSNKITFVKRHFSEIDFSEDLYSNVDVLYHLAACKHSSNSGLDENEILRTNINETYNLFENAAKNGVSKIIFTSSLYAYGQYQLPAMSESDIMQPNTIYGISKLAGEMLLKNICQQYKIRGSILRLFFVYGPGINKWQKNFSNGYKSVIIKHFEKIKNNCSPVIYGNGEQKLDYVYIDDVVSALRESVNWSDIKVPIYNIGNGKSISVNDITKLVCSHFNFDDKIEYSKADETDGTVRQSNISKITKEANWRTQTSFEQGIKNIKEWIFAND